MEKGKGRKGAVAPTSEAKPAKPAKGKTAGTKTARPDLKNRTVDFQVSTAFATQARPKRALSFSGTTTLDQALKRALPEIEKEDSQSADSVNKMIGAGAYGIRVGEEAYSGETPLGDVAELRKGSDTPYVKIVVTEYQSKG